MQNDVRRLTTYQGRAMTTILQLNASIFPDGAQSTRLAGEFARALQNQSGRGSTSRLVVRDLASRPVPHLTAERFAAFGTPVEQRTVDQQKAVAESDALIDELRQADVIVLGLPMYNFGVPSALKAYFDHVARAGVTFRYTANGPEGLLKGKKAYVFATRGGRYAGTPSDVQSAFVRQILGFLGIEDVEFVYVEGLALGTEQRDTAIRIAEARIGQLAA
jgi:FMN-dependent NADH-azoreductase